MAFYVCLLASGKHGTLYIGVTRDLVRRVYEHKEKVVPGFTSQATAHQAGGDRSEDNPRELDRSLVAIVSFLSLKDTGKSDHAHSDIEGYREPASNARSWCDDPE